LRAKNLIGEEPFLVLFGDDIIDNDISAAEQLVQKFNETGRLVIATIEVPVSEVKNYGIVETISNLEVTKFLEKPKSGTDSRRAAIGKYILTPDIFRYLETAGSSVGDGEIRLADAFIAMLQNDKIFALDTVGTRYDTGSKIGYLKACIAYAMKDEEVREELQAFLKKLTD
jgi:UTP--glucose-1-phosphate uridylyltransferase